MFIQAEYNRTIYFKISSGYNTLKLVLKKIIETHFVGKCRSLLTFVVLNCELCQQLFLEAQNESLGHSWIQILNLDYSSLGTKDNKIQKSLILVLWIVPSFIGVESKSHYPWISNAPVRTHTDNIPWSLDNCFSIQYNILSTPLRSWPNNEGVRK